MANEKRCVSAIVGNFKDPVYDKAIQLDGVLLALVDTPQFQRLRELRQLSMTYMVYPGARHSRFEHSIGVCYLAGKMIRHLRNELSKHDPENAALIVTDLDIAAVEIAGLCHDLGHGPFSHVFECIRKTITGSEWKHEDQSIVMLEDILKTNKKAANFFDNYSKVFVNTNANVGEDGFLRLVEGLILGKPKEDVGKGKRFLFEIVANKENGIDVDKFDYLLRDCYYTGGQSNFDYQRVIENCALVKDKDGYYQLCYRDKVANDLIDCFYSRYLLFRRICYHPTVTIINQMLSDIIKKSDSFMAKCLLQSSMQSAQSQTLESITKFTATPELYTKLDDNILKLLDTAPDTDQTVVKAKALYERIKTRRLYKRIGVLFGETDAKLDEMFANFKKQLNTEMPEMKLSKMPYKFSSEKGFDCKKLRFFEKESRKIVNITSRHDEPGLLCHRFQLMDSLCNYSAGVVFCAEEEISKEQVAVMRTCLRRQVPSDFEEQI